MTITAPIALRTGPEMSVAARKFVDRKEVKSMTTATVLDVKLDEQVANSYRTHGVDRAVERLGVALLRWSRTRAARTAMSGAEHSRHVELREAELHREIDAQRLTQRLGL